MSTLTVKKESAQYRQPVSLKASDLAQEIKSTISKMNSFIKDNNLVVVQKESGNESKNGLNDLLTDLYVSYENQISKMTKSAKKKLVKKLRHVNYRMTLRSMNTFLTYIHNKVLDNATSPKLGVLPSAAEQKIMATRKKYLELRAETEKVRVEYRTLKKDFGSAKMKYVS